MKTSFTSSCVIEEMKNRSGKFEVPHVSLESVKTGARGVQSSLYGG